MVFSVGCIGQGLVKLGLWFSAKTKREFSLLCLKIGLELGLGISLPAVCLQRLFKLRDEDGIDHFSFIFLNGRIDGGRFCSDRSQEDGSTTLLQT